MARPVSYQDKHKRSDLRQKLRATRRALTVEQQAQAGLGLAEVVLRQPWLAESRHIALYLSNDGEIDPAILISWLWEQGKHCYLPVLAGDTGKKLAFVAYQPETPLIKNKYNIPEPEYEEKLAIPPQDLDLVLMPLTGFDEGGRRLGMGGGFYDRTFEFIHNVEKPILVGLAHECQKVPEIPAEHWDIPMSGIATNKKFYCI